MRHTKRKPSLKNGKGSTCTCGVKGVDTRCNCGTSGCDRCRQNYVIHKDK